jgi:hypothetical protein
MSEHLCHARNCKIAVEPECLMCMLHWRKLPKALKDAVWRFYREGQCNDQDPSKEWLDAADDAIEYVYKKENKKLVKKQ